MTDCFLCDAFGIFVLLILKYSSAVWWSAADTHLKLLDRVVSSAHFLIGSVIECDTVHYSSVALLCMLYRIRCNPMHPLYGALPVQVTHYAMITHQFPNAPSHCRISQCHWTFIPLTMSLWNDLADSVFDGVEKVGFKSNANVFFIALSCSIPLCLLLFFPFSSFCIKIGIAALVSLD